MGAEAMKRETKIGLLAFLLAFSVSFAVSALSLNGAITKRISDQHRVVGAVDIVTEAERKELVTGLCTFGDCPAIMPTTEPETTTQPETQSKTEQFAKNVQIEADYTPKNVQATETDAVVYETQTTESAYEEDTFDGYIGRMYVTGYTAEEGFPLYSATSSGYGVRPGYCAMNSDQRRALGISYGAQIYVEGLGTYTVMDCGCSWGVVDIWLYTNAEAYAITGYYNVYYS